MPLFQATINARRVLWGFEIRGRVLWTRSGATGAKGRTAFTEYADEEAATQAAAVLRAQKEAVGYACVDETWCLDRPLLLPRVREQRFGRLLPREFADRLQTQLGSNEISVQSVLNAFAAEGESLVPTTWLRASWAPAGAHSEVVFERGFAGEEVVRLEMAVRPTIPTADHLELRTRDDSYGMPRSRKTLVRRFLAALSARDALGLYLDLVAGNFRVSR